MAPDEVQKAGYEIAILGMNGLDVNDPTPKYRLSRNAREKDRKRHTCLAPNPSRPVWGDAEPALVGSTPIHSR
jgi:hypothetical protein